MVSQKPTIVFVSGAFHKVESYAPTTDLLKQDGYDVTGVTLASVDQDPPQPNWDEDIAGIRNAALSAIKEGKDVVAVAHSFAGLPVSDAMKGLSKAEREKAGLKGGVVRLVYITAGVVEVGGFSQQPFNGQPHPWMRLEPDNRAYMKSPEIAAELFYNDVDPEIAKVMVEGLKSQSYGAFLSKVTYTAWRDIPSTYLICENDKCLPVELQEAMMKTPGALFEEERCSAGHSPFLSMPRFTADVIRRAAGEKI